jgi:hypothetical protein
MSCDYWSGSLERLSPAAVLAAVPEILGALSSQAVARLPSGVPRWGTLWFVALALGLWSLRRNRRVAATLFTCLLVHLAVYAAAIAATPHELSWQLAVAGDRLAMHMVPWLVLLSGARARGVGQRLETIALER